MKNIQFGRLFLVVLLVGISLFAMADDLIAEANKTAEEALKAAEEALKTAEEALKAAEEAKKDAEAARKDAEEAKKELERVKREFEEYKQQKEKDEEFDEATGIYDIIKYPIKGVVGTIKYIVKQIDNEKGYLCEKCNTWQYGSHICNPEACPSCGTIGSHQCSGPTIVIDKSEPPLVPPDNTPDCDKCTDGGSCCGSSGSSSGSQ